MSWNSGISGRARVFHKFIARVAVLVIALLPLACTQVMVSTIGDFEVTEPQIVPSPLCHSSLGAYFLPKSFVRVAVGKYTQGQGGGKPFNVLENVEAVVRPDSRRVFCLDHLASIATSDQIIITKTSSTAEGSQLLSTVASNSIDQTSIIIRRAIRAAFTAMSGFRSFRAAGDPVRVDTLANFEFDPFDQPRSAEINDNLKAAGFCLVLEDYTYGGPLRNADAYCRDPMAFVRNRKVPFVQAYAEYDAAPIIPRFPGIIYRPRTAFQLHVFMKDDPDGTGRWLLRKSIPILLENISPVLSLAVDRAVFTQKKIAFTFDRGSLLRVCIFKASEVLAAVQIPLEVVKSIARLPTQVFQLQYDEITQSKQLVQAQTNLLAAQQKYMKLLNNAESSTDSASGNIQSPRTDFQIAANPDDLDDVHTLGSLADLSTFATCDPANVLAKK
jgi:hypothetical protein